jgi:hypothetical protein
MAILVAPLAAAACCPCDVADSCVEVVANIPTSHMHTIKISRIYAPCISKRIPAHQIQMKFQ